MRHGRTGIGNWSYPLIMLWIYSTGVELGSTYRWLSPSVPVWLARYEELAVVHAVGRPDPDGSDSAKGPIQARGVRLVTKDGVYIIFWCFNRDEVLSALAQQRVEVDFQPRRFHWLYPDS